MQELRSTEILDKEIHAEARRKADKILKNADLECQKILSQVDDRVNEAESEKKKFYDKKLEALEKDESAAVPLEKERFEVSFVQKELTEKMNEYLEALSEEKRMELIFNHFNTKLLDNLNFNAFVYGFDLNKAKKFLADKFNKRLLSCEKTEFGKLIAEDDCNLSVKAGFILESEDKQVRCRLSLSEVADNIFNKYRAELADALFN